MAYYSQNYAGILGSALIPRQFNARDADQHFELDMPALGTHVHVYSYIMIPRFTTAMQSTTKYNALLSFPCRHSECDFQCSSVDHLYVVTVKINALHDVFITR